MPPLRGQDAAPAPRNPPLRGTSEPSRFRPFRIFALSKRSALPLLAVILGALAVGLVTARARFRPRPGISSTPVWDRAESAEEERLLRDALARPADRQAQAALGQHYLAARRPFEAVWALQRARDIGASTSTPGSEPGLTLALVEALEAGSLRARALSLLDEAAARSPADPVLAVRRAELQLRLGRPSVAVAILRPFASGRAVQLLPSGLSLLGRALEAMGDDAAALAQYRLCLAADAGSAEASLRLGGLLVRRGQLAGGRAALEAARRLAPASPEPAYALGMSFFPQAARDPDPARRSFMEALQVSPGYAPAQVALGRMGISHRRWELAAQHFAGALRVDPWNEEALLGLATVLEALGHPAEAHERRGVADVAQGKLPQALAEFRAVKAAAPDSRSAAILISQTLIQMGRNADAAREIKDAVARHPEDGDLKQRLAELYILSHNREPARRLCEEWLRADPGTARALWLLGRIALFDPTQLNPAIDELERAARLAPGDPEIAAALGDALFRSGPRRDPDRALSLIARAVKLAPQEPRYHYQLGLMLAQQQRLEPARRQFLRALDLDPHMTAAYTGLLQISGSRREEGQVALFAPVVRDQQEARRVETRLKQATYRSPADPSGYAALARYLSERGDLKAARAQWEVVLSLRPGDTAALQALARLNRILDAL